MKNLSFLTIAAIVALAAVFIFGVIKERPAQALTNILTPSASEDLLDFDCSAVPCRILGPKRNRQGTALQRLTYELSITNIRFNNFSSVSLVANQGDKVVLSASEQDRPSYYIFMPKLNFGHEFSSSSFPFIIDTAPLKGDYVILLQDSLDPATAATNFQAAVLRVE